MEIEDPIKATVEELLKVLAIENVIGEIIEAEDKMLIPVTRMGMGFGAGTGEGKSPRDREGECGGAGGGAGIEPIAMVVVFKGVPGPEGVKVLPLSSPGPLAKTISEIGSAAMEIVKEKKKKKEE